YLTFHWKAQAAGCTGPANNLPPTCPSVNQVSHRRRSTARSTRGLEMSRCSDSDGVYRVDDLLRAGDDHFADQRADHTRVCRRPDGRQLVRATDPAPGVKRPERGDFPHCQLSAMARRTAGACAELVQAVS